MTAGHTNTISLFIAANIGVPRDQEEVNQVIIGQLLQELSALQNLLGRYKKTIQCHESGSAFRTDYNRMVPIALHWGEPSSLRNGSGFCLENGCKRFQTTYDLLPTSPSPSSYFFLVLGAIRKPKRKTDYPMLEKLMRAFFLILPFGQVHHVGFGKKNTFWYNHPLRSVAPDKVLLQVPSQSGDWSCNFPLCGTESLTPPL